ncbi:MAG TPA: Gfo/Idh/MocA family oxidoreductase [Armatimonadetes bacterium]|nr:Gfo/Idh/MocA family oxidoreductase [Armatimonadota bacterium]
MSKYRVGIIGLGRIASTIDDEVHGYPAVLLPYSHTACYRQVPRVEIVAAADVDAAKREAYGERWGIANLYADYREMLAQERLDLVSVCTPTGVRAPIVIDCARAGVKAIYAEKPLATSLAEADEMVAVCHERGVKLAINCSRRWHPFYNRAQELIAAGEIGSVLNITAYLHCNISHNGSHLMDIVRYFADDAPVKWVFGEMADEEKARTDEDLSGNGYLAFANGITAFVRMMACGRTSLELDILGTEGRIRCLSNGVAWELWTAAQRGRWPEMTQRFFPYPQHIEAPGVRAIKDLLHCLEHGGEPACSGEDGRAVLELAIALRESHRRGGVKVELPLADRSLRIVSK